MELCPTYIQTRPRGSLGGGLRTAKLSPLSLVSGWHRSPLSWAPGGASGVTPYAHQNETSPSLGAANCETVASFVGSWEAQRSGVIRKSE